MDDRPNIVMLVSDHQVYKHHSPLMPNFEKFKKSSFVFENATCTTPLCGPVRRTILTGLYPHNHHNLYNQEPADFKEDTYLDALYRSGYDCFAYGKWHAGVGTALDHHTLGFSIKDYGNPYITDEYKKYLEEKGLPSAKHKVLKVFPNDGTAKTFPQLYEGNNEYECKSNWCGEQAIGITVTPKETHESFFLAEIACKKIAELSKSKQEKPFHLRVDFWGPHQPFFPTQEYVDMYESMVIPEYGNFRDDLKNKPATYRHMNRPIADETGNLIIPSIYKWSEWEKMLHYVYAQSTMIDAAAGKIIDLIDGLQFKRNTVLIWTSDHGDAFASHGGMFDKGSFMTEEIIRIPLAIRDNVHIGQSDALVGSIDIAPTILDYAKTELSNRCDGESFRKIIENKKNDLRENILLETYGQGYRDKTLSRCLLGKRYKYVSTQNDIEELYDLDKDPFELNNLATDPKYKSLKEKMNVELKRNCELYDDNDYLWDDIKV